MSSLAACQCVLAAAGAGVDRNRLANDKTILHQFTDLLACRQKETNKLQGCSDSRYVPTRNPREIILKNVDTVTHAVQNFILFI